MDTVWTVRIKYGWREMYFNFKSAAEAEAFAKSAIEHYEPDEETLSVNISAVLAAGITTRVEEPEE